MNGLRLYRSLSRMRVNYRAKVMSVAFVGTHVPLIALVAYVASLTTTDWPSFLGVLGTALLATLGGTGVTLAVLNGLLQPVLVTSGALRAYRLDRRIEPLPTQFGDEVGTLMADAFETLCHLEATRSRLEHVDEASGLANRASLAKEIETMTAAGRPFAVCLVAIDSFNRLSTSVGAETATAAVAQIGRRLEAFLGTATVIARVSPDQLAFIAPHQADDEACSGTAELVSDVMIKCGARLQLAGITAQPGLAAGIALHPADGATAEALLDCAAAATGLSPGRGQVAFFSPEARSEALERLRLEEDLRLAISDGGLELHYQPVVDLGRQRLVGAEALMRWRHPEHGMIAPGRFIPIAETSGLIAPMGLWALDRACAQIARWNASGQPGLRVAVNVSARQFHDVHLTDHIREALARHDVRPEQLEIELTESAAMEDFSHTRAVFRRLRELGVGIAIDDFGTGFASLSYLRRLPFDKLKVDREFVTHVHQIPESQAICSSLIALAEGLGLRVLAEGPEAEEEVHFLFSRGCSLFQGYYFGRPAPADAMASQVPAEKLRQFADNPGARGAA